MTNKEYRKADGISKSSLFKISKSPLHFKYELDNPPDKTPALIFGSAFHKIVLEPETFDTEFVIMPQVDRRTKDGKLIYAAFLENAGDKEIIEQDDYGTICAMRDSVLQNKYAAALLQGKKETSYFWDDDLTGERCKCRPDILTELGELNIISDLKSCNSADTDSFMRDCIKYGYDLQTAMYKQGVEINTGKKHDFVFIAVEKEPPYAVNILQANDLIIKRGQDMFRELIGIYHNCKQTGNWYGYNGFSGIINSLSLPAWLSKDYE